MDDPTTACERCGNWYDKPIVIRTHDSSDEHVFDSFECAIDTLAPRCEHCGCRVIGHGVEDGGRIFCCADCARRLGVEGVADRGEGHDASGIQETVSAPTRPPADS